MGAFLVESRGIFVLQKSVYTKLDNCFLLCISNSYSNLYNTFSRQGVRGVFFLGSTSARRQLPNANGFSTLGSTSVPVTRSALDAISKSAR